ncbi:MAG: hexitol phosphatase HxpB [Flavobacteriales bacterium]|nr:hexitol phosphatase HxpB [Flavobacteriales bacterium]MCB9363510.1 hexitol phosphatase HxpB [Flavobacteriales bacterium]
MNTITTKYNKRKSTHWGFRGHIEAVIYDMDGVIIDSEPFWREAIILTFKTVGLDFTEDMCRTTMGMRLIEVIEYWHEKLGWEGKSIAQVEEELLNTVSELILQKANSTDGVYQSLDYFKNKGLKIALASSSANSLIKTVLDKLELNDYFDVVNSAENLPYGKPHPMIFINTANDLGVKPINCLVIEDSFNGLLAAKAALMKTIVVPEKENQNNPHFNIADYNLTSLTQIIDLKI